MVAMIFMITASQLRQMSVQHKIPKELMINSCNLDLGKTVGQGNISIIIIPLRIAGYLNNIIPKVSLE